MPDPTPKLPFEDELRRLILHCVNATGPFPKDDYTSRSIVDFLHQRWSREIADHHYAWNRVVEHPVIANGSFLGDGSVLDLVLARLDELAEIERERADLKVEVRNLWASAGRKSAQIDKLLREQKTSEFVPHFKLHRDGSVTPLQDDTPAWTMDTMHEEDVPVALIVTEDAVEEVEITREPSSWRAGGTGVPTSWNLDKLREMRDGALQEWIEVEAIIREVEKREKEEASVEDAAVAAFKAAWHRADEEGDEGNRVRRGIRAARHVLGQEQS